MEGYIKPPKCLNLEGNIAENWRAFSQKFNLFVVATDLVSKQEETKVATFLSVIGDDGLELYNTFTFSSVAESKKLESILKKFDEYCAPKKNETFERFLFNSIQQKEGQSFDSFLTELKKAVKTTNYKDQDDMIRDKVVIGIHNKNTQEKLLRDRDLTLEKPVNLCRATEASKTQSKLLTAEPASVVNAIKRKENQCNYCGYSHVPKRCPAYNKTCAKCQKKNHFANMCKWTSDKAKEKTNKTMRGAEKIATKKRKEIYEVNEDASKEDDDGSSSDFSVAALCKTIGTVGQTRKKSEAMWTERVEINGTKVTIKLDCGAEVSVLPLEIFQKIAKMTTLCNTDTVLVSYGNSDFKLKPVGEAILECKVRSKIASIMFMIVDVKNQMPLLGLKACTDLDLIRKVDSIDIESFSTLDYVITKYSHVCKRL